MSAVQGKVIDYGSAPYQNKQENQQSYFVELKTEQGNRTLWGMGIKEAIEQKNIQKGEDVSFYDKGVKEGTRKRDWNVERYERPVEYANSIEPSVVREVEKQQLVDNAKEVSKSSKTIEDKEELDLPTSVKNQYICKVQNRMLRDEKINFYERDGDKSVIAFEDRSKSLNTSREDSKTIKAMIDVAQNKGWSSINLKGTQEFKREAWLQATVRGLETKGYKPTEQDLVELQKRQEQQTINSVSNDELRSKQINASKQQEVIQPKDDVTVERTPNFETKDRQKEDVAYVVDKYKITPELAEEIVQAHKDQGLDVKNDFQAGIAEDVEKSYLSTKEPELTDDVKQARAEVKAEAEKAEAQHKANIDYVTNEKGIDNPSLAEQIVIEHKLAKLDVQQNYNPEITERLISERQANHEFMQKSDKEFAKMKNDIGVKSQENQDIYSPSKLPSNWTDEVDKTYKRQLEVAKGEEHKKLFSEKFIQSIENTNGRKLSSEEIRMTGANIRMATEKEVEKTPKEVDKPDLADRFGYKEEKDKTLKEHVKDGVKAVAVDGAIAYATGTSFGASAVVAAVGKDKIESLAMDSIKNLSKEKDGEHIDKSINNVNPANIHQLESQLSEDQKVAVKSWRNVLDERFKNNPELCAEKHEALNAKLPDMVAGKYELPLPTEKVQPDVEIRTQDKGSPDRGR